MDCDQFPLGELPRELRKLEVVINYQRAWRAVSDGRIPAERVGGRYFINRADLPEIAATFAPTGGAQ